MSLEDAFAAMRATPSTQGKKDLSAQVPKNPSTREPERPSTRASRSVSTQAPRREGTQAPKRPGTQEPERPGTRGLVKSSHPDWEAKKFFVHKSTFRAAVRKWEDLHDGELDASDLVQHLLLRFAQGQ